MKVKTISTQNIELWIMKWSDLIENVKRRLKYMSNILQIKDIDVQEKAMRDFDDIDFGKVSSSPLLLKCLEEIENQIGKYWQKWPMNFH